MKRLLLLPVAVLLCGGSARLLAINLTDLPEKGRQYEMLSFKLAENLHCANPFDLETNRVELMIRQPDFSTRVLSFFYDGVNAAGGEQWEARFSPRQAGRYRFSVRIQGKVDTSFELPVEPARKGQQGGLKLSGSLGLFQFESGKPFRGIGVNVCWANDFDYYFRKMKAAGMNVTRIWMCPWNLPLEWKETGLGRYNLDAARRLDTILASAGKYGIYVILCMDYHGVAQKGQGTFKENRWFMNPYNKINGGPCTEAADLFTNLEAKQFIKKRYKYIASRFGHSASIAAWEFYNETDLMAGHSIPVNRWHTEMAEYLHAVDVHDHLVSTSSSRSFPEKVVEAFKSPAMDFVMFHHYNVLNVAPFVVDLHDAMTEYYEKPVVLAEFGVEYRSAERTFRADSQAVGLHNGIWAGWFSETPIAPLSWWWDDYIDKYNFWYEYAHLSRFAGMMDIHPEHLVFKTLTPGLLTADSTTQAPCMVRCIYSGAECAVWMKSDDFEWGVMSEGRVPKNLGTFTQIVPGLVPGRYSITWYDPQAGTEFEKNYEAEVGNAGELSLAVPSFSRDIACVVRPIPR